MARACQMPRVAAAQRAVQLQSAARVSSGAAALRRQQGASAAARLPVVRAMASAAEAGPITKKVFFDITIGDEPAGRVVMGLYAGAAVGGNAQACWACPPCVQLANKSSSSVPSCRRGPQDGGELPRAVHRRDGLRLQGRRPPGLRTLTGWVQLGAVSLTACSSPLCRRMQGCPFHRVIPEFMIQVGAAAWLCVVGGARVTSRRALPVPPSRSVSLVR